MLSYLRAGSTVYGRQHTENRERPGSEWYIVYEIDSLAIAKDKRDDFNHLGTMANRQEIPCRHGVLIYYSKL